MIRTQIKLASQILAAKREHLDQLALILDEWSDEDDQDEVMLKAELNLVQHMNTELKEMQSIQSKLWLELAAEAKTREEVEACQSIE
ncbi:MAG: hypothetical protein SPI35_07930 [Porphyromonas sp.]|nr:hypothetical protein [Porphyromonas sp.]